MPKKLYKVKLSKAEREHLENLVSSGTEKARKLRRARILMKADDQWADRAIGEALDVSRATVERTRQRYVEEGFTIALNGKAPQRRYERKLDGRDEAHLIALVCGPPPEGYADWSLRLLADEFVQLDQVAIDSISHETVRQVLKKTNSSRGRPNTG